MDKTRQNIAVMAVIAGVMILAGWRSTSTPDMASPFTLTGLGVWVAAFLTLATLSFLYDDNPFYRFSESLFIGVSAAYWAVQGFWEALVKKLLPNLAPGLAGSLGVPIEAPLTANGFIWNGLVPLALGIMLLWRLAPSGGWIARWPMAVIVGWMSGRQLVVFLTSDLQNQVEPSIRSLVVVGAGGGFDAMGTLTQIVLVGGVLCALIYFFFSVEHKGVIGGLSRGGIWILMVTFGAAFGYTVMGRVALLLGRMEFIFVHWLKLVGT